MAHLFKCLVAVESGVRRDDQVGAGTLRQPHAHMLRARARARAHAHAHACATCATCARALSTRLISMHAHYPLALCTRCKRNRPAGHWAQAGI
eukprot:6205862-Pleurochrysis_carterae.AAC.1